MTEATIVIKGRNELSTAVKSAERSLQSLNRQGEMLAKLFRGGAIVGAVIAFDRLAEGAEKTAKKFGDASAALSDFNRKADNATAAAKRLGAALLEEGLGQLGFGGVSREITELERKLESARKRYAAFTGGGMTGFLATKGDIAQAAAAIERYEQALSRLRNNRPYGERDRAPGSRSGGRSVVLQDLPRVSTAARQADEELWVLTDDTILAIRAWNELGETSSEAMERIGKDLSAFNQEALENLAGPVMEAAPVWTAFAEQAAANLQSAFADFLFDPFQEGLDGMLAGFVDVIRQMFAQYVAFQAITGLGSALAGSGNAFVAGIGNFLKGKRASGGPVMGGSAYLVGERGPELFVPNASGSIIPNGAAGLVFAPTYHVDARGADAERIMAVMPAILKQSEQRTLAQVLDLVRRGRLA